MAHSAAAAKRHIHSLRPIRLIFTAPIDFSARRCERIRTLNPLRAEALRDLAIGIDAGEIDDPVWSVSDRGTVGAFRSSRTDRGAQVLPPAGRDRSALASREKCPCFQFARLLRSRPSGVRGPVLLPP